jgi:EF hand
MPRCSAHSFRIGKAILALAAWVLFGALSLAAQEQRAFKGEITDCMCSRLAKRTAMSDKSGTTPLCPAACANQGAKYVLFNPEKKTVYQLDNQRRPKPFAGKDVVIIGSLDDTAQTIHISEIWDAFPAKVTQARSVYVACDACLRGMAAAEPAAFKELSDWGRFDMIPNRKKIDLIILFSANPYLGDYVTRDGPDTRPVHVDITYMNVIDPKTGESYWGDSRQWGSWFVGRATKDLIVEFREQLEAADSPSEKLLSRMDQDRDGGVSKEEFLNYMAAEFDRLDTDKNGKLDADELKKLRVLDVGKPRSCQPPAPLDASTPDEGPDR